MDYFVQSFLPHALQWRKCTKDANGAVVDNYVSEDIAVELPAGSSDKNVVKLTQEQHDFLMSDEQFPRLLTLAKGGVRFIDKLPHRMLDDKTRINDLTEQNRKLQAELAQAKATQVTA